MLIYYKLFNFTKKFHSMIALAKTFTAKEYIEIERAKSPDLGKSEFYKNQIIPMSGTSRAHNNICAAINGILFGLVENDQYEVYQADMRVISFIEGKEYFYPDNILVHGEPQFEDHHFDILNNPTLIFEVLSDSTKDFDRIEKFISYRQIPAFQEYILVNQYNICVEQFYKNDRNEWVVGDKLLNVNQTLQLKSVPFKLDLKRIYSRVQFKI